MSKSQDSWARGNLSQVEYYGVYGWLTGKEASEMFKKDFMEYEKREPVKARHRNAKESFFNAFRFRTKCVTTGHKTAKNKCSNTSPSKTSNAPPVQSLSQFGPTAICLCQE